MPIFDFKCPHCFTKFEKLVKHSFDVEPCIKCKSNALKQLSAPRIHLDAMSGDFPGATLKWENNHPPHDPVKEAARQKERQSYVETVEVEISEKPIDNEPKIS